MPANTDKCFVGVVDTGWYRSIISASHPEQTVQAIFCCDCQQPLHFDHPCNIVQLIKVEETRLAC